MYRPHRHLDSKGREERQEDQLLHIERKRKLMPCEDIETARLEIQINQRHQHQQRTEKGVQKKLDRCIHAARSTPDTNDDEHRY